MCFLVFGSHFSLDNPCWLVICSSVYGPHPSPLNCMGKWPACPPSVAPGHWTRALSTRPYQPSADWSLSCAHRILWLCTSSFGAQTDAPKGRWSGNVLRMQASPYMPWFNWHTRQGCGGSFKDRKPKGEVDCCQSWMAKRTHWWLERWFECRAMYLSIYLSIFLCIYLFVFYLICQSICLFFYLSICLSICLIIYLFFVYAFICLSTCRFIYLFIYLLITLSNHLSVYLFIQPSLYLSIYFLSSYIFIYPFIFLIIYLFIFWFNLFVIYLFY